MTHGRAIATHLATDGATLLEHSRRWSTGSHGASDIGRRLLTRYGWQSIRDGELEYAIDGIERLVIWKVGRLGLSAFSGARVTH
jgi:hypothetical protein